VANQPLPTAAQPQNLDKFWEAQKTPFGRIVDPINDPFDATRSAMNPFLATKPSAPPASRPAASGSDSFAFGSSLPSASRSDFVGPASSRFSATPSYSPPPAAPASAPAFQPKPAVLEIPRPRL
jgi:hypothetical protein